MFFKINSSWQILEKSFLVRLSSQPPDKKETELSSAWFKDDLFYVLGVAGCKEILEEDWNQFGIRGETSTSRYTADSRSAPSQWETPLQSNAVSHWLGTNLESILLA